MQARPLRLRLSANCTRKPGFKARRVFTAVDAFERDEHGGVRRHFILIAVLCRWLSGQPIGGDDALEARWFDLAALESADLAMSFGVAHVARQAHALALADLGERRDWNR
jgi:8-oxo-dGTP diphosphatase